MPDKELNREQLCFKLGKFHEWLCHLADNCENEAAKDMVYCVLDEFNELFGDIGCP